MNLDLLPRRVVEAIDRRVLGAFRFVDAATRLPVVLPVRVDARAGTIGTAPALVLDETLVRIAQNRRGDFVVFRAPLFDAYTAAFLDPQRPAETVPDPLRLQLAIADAGSYYLPQTFHLDLPRSLDPAAADSVFRARDVRLFRAPNAPVQDGWALLRVRVTQAAVAPPNPLPAVLIRVFRSPRGAADAPIGEGMTEWRGGTRGEALVPLIGLERFRPGSGQNVIETDHAIEFEAARPGAFTGSAGELPDVPALLAAAGTAPTSTPATPLRVEAGREYAVHLQLP